MGVMANRSIDRIDYTAIMFAFRQGMEPGDIAFRFQIAVDHVYMALLDELCAMRIMEDSSDPRTKIRRMPNGRLAKVWK